jgi:ribosomal-protein-alanine N-acetyltransferase
LIKNITILFYFISKSISLKFLIILGDLMKIKGDGFIIRNFLSEDAASLAKHANNSKIWINLRDHFPHPYSLEDAEKFISMVNLVDPVTNYAIEVDNECVGAIGFILGKDFYARTAELGYWLGEEYWNKGIMTKAVNLFTNFIFDYFDIIRIQASVFDWNPASGKVLSKAGFELEARLRKNILKNGTVVDELIFAKLKE